jgi:hypothetical protein
MKAWKEKGKGDIEKWATPGIVLWYQSTSMEKKQKQAGKKREIEPSISPCLHSHASGRFSYATRAEKALFEHPSESLSMQNNRNAINTVAVWWNSSSYDFIVMPFPRWNPKHMDIVLWRARNIFLWLVS